MSLNKKGVFVLCISIIIFTTIILFSIKISAQLCTSTICYSGLPENFKPSLGYYHQFLGGRISLWDVYGNIYQSADGTTFNKLTRSSLANQGLPEEFKPKIGFYQNISYRDGSGRLVSTNGSIYLFNKTSVGYKTKDGVGSDWDNYGNNKKMADGLPDNYAINTSFYSKYKTWNVTLWGKDGSIYVGSIDQNPGSGSILNFTNMTNRMNRMFFDNNPYPVGDLREFQNKSPVVALYYNISRNLEGNLLFYNISGSPKIVRTNETDAFNAGSLSLPTDKIPTVGYYDEIRKRIVIWYGSEIWESDNGNSFYLVNCDQSCTQSFCYSNIPSDFSPILGYYHQFLGGRISLWNSTGEIYQSADGTTFNKLTRSSLANQGLPEEFKPISGGYHNYSNNLGSASGGRIFLFDKNGRTYKTYPHGDGGAWTEYTQSEMQADGLPPNFKPVIARYTFLPRGINELGVFAIINSSGTEYRRKNTSENWIDATEQYSRFYPNYPKGKAPVVTYYFNLYGDEGVDYWFNMSGNIEVYRF
ncbi:MAG: hypothetical protein QXI33_02395, partial [Candidatus Pacearchaeota archaeon]